MSSEQFFYNCIMAELSKFIVPVAARLNTTNGIPEVIGSNVLLSFGQGINISVGAFHTINKFHGLSYQQYTGEFVIGKGGQSGAFVPLNSDEYDMIAHTHSKMGSKTKVNEYVDSSLMDIDLVWFEESWDVPHCTQYRLMKEDPLYNEQRLLIAGGYPCLQNPVTAADTENNFMPTRQAFAFAYSEKLRNLPLKKIGNRKLHVLFPAQEAFQIAQSGTMIQLSSTELEGMSGGGIWAIDEVGELALACLRDDREELQRIAKTAYLEGIITDFTKKNARILRASQIKNIYENYKGTQK